MCGSLLHWYLLIWKKKFTLKTGFSLAEWKPPLRTQWGRLQPPTKGRGYQQRGDGQVVPHAERGCQPRSLLFTPSYSLPQRVRETCGQLAWRVLLEFDMRSFLSFFLFVCERYWFLIYCFFFVLSFCCFCLSFALPDT